MKEKEYNSRKENTINFMAGAFSGLFSDFSVHPFDTYNY
jgi:hypothetical protein